MKSLSALLLGALFAVLISGCATQVPLNSTQQVAELSRMIRDKDLDGAVALMQQYPDNLDDRRALSVAVHVGNADAVRFFAKRTGADAYLDLDDTTALIDTITRAPPAARAKVVRALLELGANPDRQDKFGQSAGALAELRNEVELLDLMDRYASPVQGPGQSKMLSWFPPPGDVTLVADASAAAGRAMAERVSEARRARDRRAHALAVAPEPTPALLTASVWLPTPPSGATGPLAGFRFHADGTGELLRYLPRERQAERVAKSTLAWTLDEGTLRFVVVSEQFSALCDSKAINAERVDLHCIDYTRVVQRDVSFLSPSNEARDLLERPPSLRSSVLRGAASVDAQMFASAEPGCKVAPGPRVPPAPTLRRNAPAGDWYAFSPSKLEAFAPLSGMACRPAEAERAAMISCRKGARDCHSLGGCRSGEVSAVAAVHGQRTAWVGCDADVQAARDKALALCRASAGCDCQLIALNGQNLNIARQAACGG